MRRVLGGVRALLRRREIEQDLDDELRAYLEAAVEQNLASGMSPEEARRAARLNVGSIEATKDAVRDVGWESWIESVWQDVRYAFRRLRRFPGFAAVAILTLALGIGANTTIFSIVNGLLLRALPVTAPEQLVTLESPSSIDQGFPAGWAYPVWDQFRQRSEALGGAVAWSVFLEQRDLAQGGETDPVDGLFVSWNFFAELGVPPLLGRTFTVEEDVLGHPDSRVAVISYGLWQRRFGGAADIVGQTMLVDRVPVTIIGVTPPEFLGPEVGRAFEIALPIGSAPIVVNDDRWGTPEGFSYLAIMLRLRPERSIAGATTLLRRMQREIVEAAFPPHPVWGPHKDLFDPFVLVPASTGTSELRRQYSRSLMIVSAIAALLLLIACANVAHLLLSRAAASHRELTTRVALGAPRWRVVQQSIVESLVLSTLGTIAGLLFAAWGSRALVAQLSTMFDRIVLDVSLDWRVLTFSAAATMATALLFGATPAFRTGRVAVGNAVRTGVRVRGGLVAAQVALSLVLVIAAGLFIRTFERVASVPLGFDSDRVLVVNVNPRRALVGQENRTAFYQRLVDAVKPIPGVTGAAASLSTPVSRSVVMVMDVGVRNGPPQTGRERPVVVNYVTPAYFATYGTSVRAGRSIDDRDTHGALRVAVVNEAFVRRFLPGVDPIGKAVTSTSPTGADMSRTIVGVVDDAIEQTLRDDAGPTVYHPLTQWEEWGFPQPAQINLSVRAASGPPILLARSVAAALTAVERDLAFTFRPLADQVDAARHQERLVAWLSGLFGALALLLASIGLYGVTSYAVAQRRTEIGIRMALGARRPDVVRLAVRQTILMTICGVAVGLTLAAALTRYLQALLFGVTPLDPLTFIAAPALLVAVALLASYVPARRATTIDPMTALRCE
jgi:putative ABC transport system permease protein